MSALIALMLTAGAAELVLYEGQAPDEALAAVSALAPDGEYVVKPLDEVFGRREPVLRGGGRLRICEIKRLPASTLRDRLKRIEGAWLYQEFAEAQTAVKDAIKRLPCLDGPVETDLLTRLHYLDALAAFEREDETGSAEAFGRALAVDADFAWDDNFAKDSQRVLQIQRDTMKGWAPVVVEAVPAAGATLDGKPMLEGGIEVAAGQHLLQVGVGDRMQGVLLDVDEGARSTVIVPAAAPAAALGWVGDPELDRDLSLLLAAVTERDEVVWIVHEDAIWRGVPSRREWEKKGEWIEPIVHVPEEPDTPIEPVLPPPEPRRDVVSVPLTALGAGVGAFGGYLAADGYTRARKHQEEGLTASGLGDEPGVIAANEALGEANNQTVLGDVLLVAGVGIAAVGVIGIVKKGKTTVGVGPTGVVGSW